MKRVVLFLATNIAVLVVLAVVWRLLGFESILQDNGVDLDLGALLAFSAIFGMGGAFISLLLSKTIAKWSTGAKVVDGTEGRDAQWLVETVRAQARAAGIGMPEVAVYSSPAPNAFATGARRDAALVAVSTGLLESMSHDEVEAVLGHEVSHVANGDMITLTLVQGVLNVFVIFFSRVVGFLVDRLVFRNERGIGIGFFVTSLVAQIVFGILASAIVAWFSRQREFRADAGGARLAGAPKMIAALEALANPRVEQPLPDSLNAFGIRGRRHGLAVLFSTHPPIEDRIARLKQASGA